jgi:hypothetical protein
VSGLEVAGGERHNVVTIYRERSGGRAGDKPYAANQPPCHATPNRTIDTCVIVTVGLLLQMVVQGATRLSSRIAEENTTEGRGRTHGIPISS